MNSCGIHQQYRCVGWRTAGTSLSVMSGILILLGVVRYLYFLDRMFPAITGISPLCLSVILGISGVACTGKIITGIVKHPSGTLLIGARVGIIVTWLLLLVLLAWSAGAMVSGGGAPELNGLPLLRIRSQYLLESHGRISSVTRQEFVMHGYYDLITVGTLAAMPLVLAIALIAVGQRLYICKGRES